MLTIFRFLCFLFLLIACTHSNNAETKSPLNNLNGEHYNISNDGQTDIVLGIPLNLTSQNVRTRIRGTVMLDQKPIPIPLGFIEVALTQNGKELLKTRTEGNGEFSLSGVLRNGDYIVKAKSAKYMGQTEINIHEYDIKNVIVLIKNN